MTITDDTTCQADTGQVLDLLPVGAAILSSDLTVCHWNSKLEEWTGIPREKMVGEKLSSHFPNIQERRYLERLQQVFTSGTPATYSPALHRHFLPVPLRHGLTGLTGEKMVQETEVRIFSRDPLRALVTIQDVSFQFWQLEQLKQERAELLAVTERLEETNHQLKARNTELDEFCYVASHDLQEPLRKITTFCNLFEKNFRQKLDGDGLKYLEFMSSASRRMKTLISDLLSLSRAGRDELKLKPVDLNQCVAIALDRLDESIKESNAAVDSDTLPVVHGDPRLIAQVYQNLLANSIKFVAPGVQPKIHISAENADSYCTVTVRDNGLGVEADYVEQIFKPFKRLHGLGKFPGSGIGLSICKRAVSRMGGEIWAAPDANAGCRINFTLPLATDDATDGSVSLSS